MSRFPRLSIFSLLLLLFLQITHVSGARDQFQHWYPEFDFIFDRIVRENCSSEYHFYLTAQKNRTYWHETSRWIGSGSTAALSAPLVNCIMGACPEYMKSNMASANVLLGLAPMILATLGSDVDETSVLAVIGNRPFFALCLTVGSPAVIALRAFDYRDPQAVLKDRPGRLPPMFFNFHIELLITVLEYALVFAAITNVGTLGYQLGRNVALSFAPNYGYLILLWCFFSPIGHMVAAWTLRLRVHWPGHTSIKRYGIPCFSLSSFDQLKTFFVGYTLNEPPPRIELKKETPLYILLSWILSLLTAAHVMLGTLVFSSMLFISVRDSVAVITRFMGSVIVCRVVLMYEVAKLRHLYNLHSREEGGVQGSGEIPSSEYRLANLGPGSEDLQHHTPRRYRPYGATITSY
ncbi:hypothetical protein ACN38_g6119 [Penicillium nordicum]|uniref:Uncharacterized protein n=1 Tax=Penicillium nordicum TaxID=229535 RepID=A0A0M8P3V4_9EURO|nr:hypothetical protein ACN38_g6119 [Penicillium nordicum]